MKKILNSFNSKKDDTADAAVPIKKIDIPFSTHKALAVLPAPTDKAEDVIKALNLEPYKAVFLNLGNRANFDDKLVPKLIQLFSRGIANAALEADALIVDEGVQAGVISLMGKGVSDRGNKSILVGMAAANEVTYPGGPATGTQLEPNHSHFILLEKDNADNGFSTMATMVNLLINRPDVQNGVKFVRKVPALAILTGGDETTKEMLLLAVRQNININIIEGSGGLADEIAAALRSDTPPEEPTMAEIIADGKLLVQSLADSIEKVKKDILNRLGVDNVLMQAWETFADYDLNANLQQKKFDQIQQAIIIIGVVGTALAIIKEVVKSTQSQHLFIAGTSKFIYYLLIIIPITLTLLIAIVNRFKQGNKWLLLRAASEAIKREIFRYRTRTNDYSNSANNTVIAAQQLSKKIEDITTRTMRTEVNSAYLVRYDKRMGFPPDMYAAKGGDDGFSNLSPEKYIEVRLGDQLNYFQKRSIRLGKQLNFLSITSFIVGGIGTFLAAINQPVWIALTTTIVAALGTYLAYRQTENTLTKYNQTATNLTNIKTWWMALTPKEQILQANINSLVEHTEQILQVELDGWIQQMQNALAELRKNQETKPEINENTPAEEKVNKPDAKDETKTDLPAANTNKKPDTPDGPTADEKKTNADDNNAANDDDTAPINTTDEKDIKPIIDVPNLKSDGQTQAPTTDLNTTVTADKNQDDTDKPIGTASTFVQTPNS